jgi:hypothetical protein
MSDTEDKTSVEKVHMFDKPKNVQRVIRGLFIICVGLVLADLVIHRHVSHPLEALFSFYAFYGFFACVVLVLIAKEMRKFLMRDEDYYDRMDD